MVRKMLHSFLLQLFMQSQNIMFRYLPERGFPGDSDGKEFAHSVGDLGSIPGKFPGEGNGNPLQYSWLEKSMDRGVWWATIYGVAKSQT